jgi:hypothetical protein
LMLHASTITERERTRCTQPGTAYPLGR